MEPNVYKVTTAGDGSLYTWNKYSPTGEILETSQQLYNTEADAEKAVRAIMTGDDRLEVSEVKNINSEANGKVDLVMPPEDLKDRDAGMTRIGKGIEERAQDGDKPLKRKGRAGGSQTNTPVKKRVNKPSKKAKTRK